MTFNLYPSFTFTSTIQDLIFQLKARGFETLYMVEDGSLLRVTVCDAYRQKHGHSDNMDYLIETLEDLRPAGVAVEAHIMSHEEWALVKATKGII